ncbi:MAG: hypothetical protein ABSC10_19240 [Candidatus Acidiferrales bacterium]|jgi:hypothetical protein
MKLSGLVATAFLFLALCQPAVGRPSAANSPHKWFHSRHPEKSNPHYKDASHRHGHSNHRARQHSKP